MKDKINFWIKELSEAYYSHGEYILEDKDCKEIVELLKKKK